MSNPNEVLTRIRLNKETGKLWQFPGGIHPLENKKQSSQKPIRTLNLFLCACGTTLWLGRRSDRQRRRLCL